MNKIISIFLSFLMLASSSGIAYAQHFCGGLEMMSEITLGEKNLSCGMAMEADSLGSVCGEDTAHSEAHDCCDNHITKIQIDDNFAKASFNIDLTNTFIATFVSVFVLQEVEIASVDTNFFAEYTPPPLERDLNILYGTFLI